MNIRIAILAACAGTLALAQADVARASYGAAAESKSPMSTTEFGPKPTIRLAQSRPWTHGQQPMMGGARFDPGSIRVDDKNQALGQVSTTRGRKLQSGEGGMKRAGTPAFGQPGKFPAGQKTKGNETNKPSVDGGDASSNGPRKLQPGNTGKAAIFDRGQEIPMTSY